MKKWTKEEINHLRDNYSHKLDKELSRELNRSLKGISYFARKLGLRKDREFYARSRKKTNIEFSKEELEREYLIKKKSIRTIANEMKVSKTTIEHYFKKFAIKRRTHEESIKINPEKHGWTRGLNKNFDTRVFNLAKSIKKAYSKKRAVKIKEIENKYKVPFKEVIYNLYWKECLSQERIAKILNFNKKIIIDFMRNFKISKRPKYQYISLLKGEKHSQFGKSWDLIGKAKADIRRKEAGDRFRELTIRRLQKNEFPFFDTKIEIKLAKGLIERRILFVKQFRIGNFVCDFALPYLKIVIECDGDYWHANPKIYSEKELTKTQKKKVEVDKNKEKFLKKEGWTLIRFFESEINSHLSLCLDKIEQISSEELKKIKSPIDSLF